MICYDLIWYGDACDDDDDDDGGGGGGGCVDDDDDDCDSFTLIMQ